MTAPHTEPQRWSSFQDAENKSMIYREFASSKCKGSNVSSSSPYMTSASLKSVKMEIFRCRLLRVTQTSALWFVILFLVFLSAFLKLKATTRCFIWKLMKNEVRRGVPVLRKEPLKRSCRENFDEPADVVVERRQKNPPKYANLIKQEYRFLNRWLLHLNI